VDREEFTSFYAASFPWLVGQLSAMTGNPSEAQDAVQEAFVRAWVHRDQINTDREAEAWVRVTAWRIAVSRWQRARKGLRLMLLAARPDVAAGLTLTALPSSRRCGRFPPSSAARWCCITWLT
jgi:RNA polymerase sigma-70 factor, ECF subfamily